MSNNGVDLEIALIIGDEYKDTGWTVSNTSMSHRGITDFIRVIQPNRELSEQERCTIAKLLQEDPKCPGWTGVMASKAYKGPGVQYWTTWDSSD